MITNKLSNIEFVNRISFIQNLCKDRKVLHLGATDMPETKNAIANDIFLHQHINSVAKKLVGMDIDIEMIDWLSQNHGYNNILYGNIEKLEDYPKQQFDIIIAGEIFEHLSNPGKALESIRSFVNSSTKLVITVPNAYSLKGFLRSLVKHELIHPDHTLHHSPHTLKALLERHRFSIVNYFSYVNSGKGIVASLTNSFIRSNPQVAEGIGVICEPQ